MLLFQDMVRRYLSGCQSTVLSAEKETTPKVLTYGVGVHPENNPRTAASKNPTLPPQRLPHRSGNAGGVQAIGCTQLGLLSLLDVAVRVTKATQLAAAHPLILK